MGETPHRYAIFTDSETELQHPLTHAHATPTATIADIETSRALGLQTTGLPAGSQGSLIHVTLFFTPESLLPLSSLADTFR